MREHKFRAWYKPTKVMGEPETIQDMTSYTPSLDIDDRFILMQYTGLLDSYATEEYIGDIIEEEDGTKRIIEDGNSVVYFINTKEKFDVKYFWHLKVHKVIGNIYSNPELLEVKCKE